MARSSEQNRREQPRRGRRYRRHGRSRRDRAAHAEFDELDSALRPSQEEDDERSLDPEQRALLEARRAAELKVRLWGRFWRTAMIGIPLLIFVPWAGFLFLCCAGVMLARRAYGALYEPRLRERLIHEEVSKRRADSRHREPARSEVEHARSLEKLSASIAHEIRNPITAAKSLVQQMGEDPGGGDNAEYARVALRELERVERSISHLLRFAREEELRCEPLRMLDVVESALETFRERAAREGVEIVREFDSEGALEGDPEKLRRVVINLVGNAMDSLADADVDKPRIAVSMGENLAGNQVWLRIVDNGPGVAPEAREQIFNPFYTSKTGGTGLGLPITRKLVEAHAGRIELVSEPGRGAEFVLSFPKAGGSEGDPL